MAVLLLLVLMFIAITSFSYWLNKKSVRWELQRRKLDLQILREELSGAPGEETTLDRLIAEHGGRK